MRTKSSLLTLQVAENENKMKVRRANNSTVSKMEPVVISGLSGRFPESSSLDEFAENLFGGVDMITEDARRWTPGFLGLPTCSGKLKDLDQFDADYFSTHAKQADFMDPELRILLEVTHEAIMDAGVNPKEVRGQNVGVFIGAIGSDSQRRWMQNTEKTHGYVLTGCERTMLSNRISFEFDFKGPSVTLDTACSSSLMALEQACTALKYGHCDSAIVGGVHLCLDPKMSLQFYKLNMLSPQGKCQSFDAAGDGYVRSEAVVAIFIQRKNVARRHYASILGVKTNTDGHKTEGVTFPSGHMQKALLKQVYEEAGVDPRDVVYVEAHGTGTPAGDPQELNAIAEVFCTGRNEKNPLLIGSVKSNMGHSEPASGLCGLAKVLLAMQRGTIPANLHYTTANPKINALQTGQLKVVSENTKWNGGIVGINSFGFGGANVHAILQSNSNWSLNSDQDFLSSIPLIIPFSGRSKNSVESALKQISTENIDKGRIKLLHKIHITNLPGHQFRGFAVVPQNQTDAEILVEEIETQTKSPEVWFIFNGMGSQWAGMGQSLLKFQICKESLQKSAAVLKSKNLNLLEILLNGKEESFDNVLNSFVSIAAVQIAVVDLLTSLKIKPDGILGHSVGELGAAYADNCLTAEQVILTAHARGEAILEMGAGDGAMAAVGLSWEDAKQKCPNGIYPACHNSKDSVTVSGPAKLIDDFVNELQKEGVFARKVNSSNQAFHSKYIQPAEFKFKESLDKIIPVSTPRSNRWISSSIPESQWNSELAKNSSADYHVNNLISPVLFQEALKKVPASSVVIEIGPHCLLQAILKRSLSNCSHVGLLNKNHKDNLIFLCESIGKMFNFGLNPLFSNLYPQVQFPVPLETPSLSSLVSKCWDHSKSWNVPSFSSESSTGSIVDTNVSGGLDFEISLGNEKYAFYAGHKIDGRIIFPQTGLIVLAWKAWAKINHGNVDFEKIPFTIENLVVSRATIMPKKGEPSMKFNVNLTKSTGEFRIEENGFIVASGTIRSPAADDFISVDPIPIPEENAQEIALNQQDFYKFLKLRGYEYSGVFQGVKRAGLDWDWAEVEFSNWAAFLDGLLHPLVGCHGDTKSLLLPTRLKKLVLDPDKFWANLSSVEGDSNSVIAAFHNPNIQVISCAGLQIQGQKLEPAPRNQNQTEMPVLEKFQFTPFFYERNSNSNFPQKHTDDHCLQSCIGLVLENLPGDELNILEISQNPEKIISPSVKEFCRSQPKKSFDATVITSDSVKHEEGRASLENSGIRLIHKNSPFEYSKIIKKTGEKINLVVVHEVTDLKDAVQNETIGIFVLLRVEISTTVNLRQIDLKKLSHKISHDFEYYLFRKFQSRESTGTQTAFSSNVIIATCENSSVDFNFDWVENLKIEMRKATRDKIEQGFRINVIARSFDSGTFCPSGILGLVNSLRREPGGQALRCFFINDPNSPVFDFQQPDPELEKQVERDLLMNVFQNGVWGSFRFFPLPPQNTRQVENAYLNFQKRGDLSSFQWFESPLKYSKQELCSVFYSALNFRDVMLASGKLNPGSLPNNLGNADCVLGMEFSGLDSTGKRVMGILPAKAMATSVIPDPGFLWEIPASWSLADGATIPVAYATAYYALCVRGRLKEGESVLIHGGAGAVGLAAISIALSKNCRVFTTVGSKEKREFLKNNFHRLDDSSFANSRDASFLQHIMNETKGRGVDVVLNSLAGEKLLASVECIAQHGRFLELGKVDLFNDTKLGMSILLKNVNFSGILLDSLTNEDSDQNEVWNLVQNGIQSGVVQPMKHTLFLDSTNEIEKAFRFMASGKHIGKILIQIREEGEKFHEKMITALPRTYFEPLKSFIILGGLGGFGLELCDWMIERGATKLVLVSRSGVTTGYQKFCLNRWTKFGAVSVVVCQVDATTFEGATEILKQTIEVFNGSPIGGIFNLAMVLRDGVLENQTPENFEAVAKPKIHASMAMDKASRVLAPELEYFVCFSSVVSGRGAPGLSNYAYANSALERICENRKQDGLPGLAVMWGAIGDVGVMAEQFKLNEEESVEGTAPQRICSCLNTLDTFLQSSAQSKRGAQDYSTLSSFAPSSKSQAEQNVSNANWVESIARILGLDAAELEKDPCKTLQAFGMDSLMAAEIKQVVSVFCKRTVDALELQTFSLRTLQEIMPAVSKHQADRNLKIETKIRDSHAMNMFEPSCTPVSESNFRFQCKGLPSEDEATVQENPARHSTIQKSQTRKKANVHTVFCENLRQGVFYFLSMLYLILIYLILSPISSSLRLCAQFHLWLFQDSKKIKLMDGIKDPVYIENNLNLVVVQKFSGLPNKEELMQHLNERLFNVQTGTNLSCDASEPDLCDPFERLKWSIEKGVLFGYWHKDENFDVSRHVIFEEIATANENLDSEMPRLAKHYHNLKWDEKNGSTPATLRPWWEFRVVYSEKAQEFLLVFSWNHAYGDGPSAVRLLQQILDITQGVPAVSKPVKNAASPPRDNTFSKNSFHSSVIKELGHFLVSVKHALCNTHLLVRIFADLLSKTWETRSDNFCIKTEPHAASAFGKFPLSKLKFLKDPETGKSLNLNAVVLTICARVYRRIVKESAISGTDGERPLNLLPAVTWAPFENSDLNLSNNAVTFPIKIPLTFGSNLEFELEQEQDHVGGSFVNEYSQNLRRTLSVTEKELARTGRMENLLIIKSFLQHPYTFPFPLLRLFYCVGLRSSFLFSNVLAVLPRTENFLQVHNFQGAYGYHAPYPISLIGVTDSVHDSLTLTVSVSETILKTKSPQFHSLFFPFFEQEVNQLQKYCSKKN